MPPATVKDAAPEPARRDSLASEGSLTAADIIQEQMQLEADAREALPYSTEMCTNPMGSLRQAVYACLTCNPPESPLYQPAGMCYSCSVRCHGEHTLVEIFQKRNFTCDCGTARFPMACAIRHESGSLPDANNRYNHNFRNRFCACECDYDPFDQKGTMFQCLGLGTVEDGGCGEDWYHPGCLVGLGPKWYEGMEKTPKKEKKDIKIEDGTLPAIEEEGEKEEDDDDDDAPLPDNFPKEDDFEGFICYKCVEAHPSIKKYAGAPGFLPAVFVEGGLKDDVLDNANSKDDKDTSNADVEISNTVDSKDALDASAGAPSNPKKRKADDDAMDTDVAPKRHRSEAPDSASNEPTNDNSNKTPNDSTCKLNTFPPPPSTRFSLFFTEPFRDHLCHCPPCYRHLHAHPHLLEEEDVYEPPLSEDGANSPRGSTRGSGSLYDRGESALANVDRVRAIEGVMAYNHLKEQLKPFFAQFAGSGRAISADDIKEYFAKLRGDDGAIAEAGERPGK